LPSTSARPLGVHRERRSGPYHRHAMSGDDEKTRIEEAVRAKLANYGTMTDKMAAEVILELYGTEPSRASVDRVLAYVAEFRADSAA